MATRTASSRSSRPRLPACGYVFDELICDGRGEHFCQPRAARAVAFFEEILVHTKDRWARRAFKLDDWQRDEIIRPLFGRVVWSVEHECYRRRYVTAWIELARKNGKSELLAGIALLLLIGDDVASSEVYGAAKDSKQARKVWDVAVQMVKLSPTLSRRLTINKQEKRIYDEASGSYYEIITSDAAGELGHNPQGIVFDEVLAQKNPDLWNALETAMGTRVQPLMVAATTAGADPSSWCAELHETMSRVLADPESAPHVLVVMRNTPADADPWDETNWYFANPALGSFLSVEALRREALMARKSPAKENAFRQFRLNQWVRQLKRWMPVQRWDESAGMVVEEQLEKKTCYGGLDIGRTDDVAAWVLAFPGEPGPQLLWRFFIPADHLEALELRTNGAATVWRKEGRIVVTDGNVVDYTKIRSTIVADSKRFDLEELAFNQRGAQQLAQQLQDEDGLDVIPMTISKRLAAATADLERLVLKRAFVHGGHPVARWMIDNLAVKTDSEENAWPDKGRSGDVITGPVAAVMALDRLLRAPKKRKGAAGF